MKTFGVTIQLTPLAVLSHGTICFSAFYDMKFGSFGEF